MGTVITLPGQGNLYYNVSGYVFDGWKDTNGTAFAAGVSYTVTADVTLTAQWKKVTGGTTEGLYMGIIGFSDGLTTRDISRLTYSNRSDFKSFINNTLTQKSATVLYYAVEQALDQLQYATLPENLINVSIITFTDGLDQGSVAMNPTYEGSGAAYLAAIKNRIQTETVKDLKIDAYSIGIKGDDVTNDAQFETNLNSLASSADYVYMATTMSQVSEKFEAIAGSLVVNVSSSQNIALTIPMPNDGEKVRFTFDVGTGGDVEDSELYIEGTWSFGNKSLTNVVYAGCTSTSGTTVVSTLTSGSKVTFSFTGLQPSSGSSVPTNTIKEWFQSSSESSWQISSEFTNDTTTVTTVESNSAVILLVLDCSSSLGANFGTIKSYANNFIDKLTAPQ
jgi:uncharacterized repeat protein (TIGR02543 family)